MLYKTEEVLLYKAKKAEGKSFGEIDITGRIENERAKGHLGQIVEESYFGYEVNSKSEADFAELGIELKVTPIKQNKNGTLSAKERLVLNIINYFKEIEQEFKTSSFWKKNEIILIMFYLWIPTAKRKDYKIIKSYLHKFSEDDLLIIEEDWNTIVSKIRNGEAHELSEADTNYLAACTKGASKKALRQQPFNSELAMQRAFSLKQSYMTTLVRKVIDKEHLQRFTSSNELKHKTFIQLLEDKFKPYKNMTIEEISYKNEMDINTQSKSFLQQFVSGLLGIQGTKLDKIEEFAKANIQFKTIRLEPNGISKEHMSFKNIDFLEWATEEWDESWLKNYFEETKILFVIFYYNETKSNNPNRKLYFRGIKLWNMPHTMINDELKGFWLQVQKLINQGIELEHIQQKNRVIVRNNLPKPNSNGICHVRPKGKDGNDKTALPDGRFITKQAFWFDKNFVRSIIE